MGTTATSLHVLRPPRSTTATLVPDVAHAYRKLGFALQRKHRAGPTKRVVLAGGNGDAYLSIYDSDNDQIDSGDLQELAVLLSKRLARPVIFTSVYDSDRYEFIVFYRGKQKDAAVSDPSRITIAQGVRSPAAGAFSDKVASRRRGGRAADRGAAAARATLRNRGNCRWLRQ